MMDELQNTQPRVGKNSEKPGIYMISPQLSNHLASPKDKVKLQLYINGYGDIQNCRISVNYPDDLLNYNCSYVFKDIGNNNGSLEFGRNHQNLQRCGFSIDMQTGGHVIESWTEKTPNYFFDVTASQTPQIATAMELSRSPLEMDLTINETAKAGVYTLYVYMIYFDGAEWKSDRIEIPLTVTSLFQRNEVLFTRLAIILAGV